MRRFLLISFLLSVTLPGGAQDRAGGLHRAQQAVTSVIVHDIFSPPVASRIYFYSSLAAYEAAVIEGGHHSFRKVRPDFPAPSFGKEKDQIDAGYAAVYALLYTASRFVFSDTAVLDSLRVITSGYQHLSASTKQQSEQWAKKVSDSVYSWSRGDNYAATRKMKRYSVLRQPGAWKPTPPGYFAAVEPYWGRMRTICIDSMEKYRPVPPIAFSSQKGTPFHQQAMEVYEASRSLSGSDSAIAFFWDCNPFYLNTQGHLNFATKKLSPGGHWMSIAGIASRSSGASFSVTLRAYLATSVALYDAFISCWDEKYRSNTIRPESYINSYIDESWRPLLQTPPFPEYTSGHSVISSASARVLTSIFGEGFRFRDDTEVPYGLPVREFTSFWQAAEEAAVSRFYGGIHYKQAVEQGMEQGKRIGDLINHKLQALMSSKQ